MRNSSNSKKNHLRHDQFDLLSEVVCKTDEMKEVRKLLRSLMTVSERAIIEQRLDIARMLLCGKNYQEINSALGVSTSTIMNGARLLRGFDKKIRQLLKVWQPLKEKETAPLPSSSESGSFFRAVKPGAIRRVHKTKI